MKKVICTVLIFALIFANSFYVSALSEGDWEYKILENEVIITKYNGNDEYVVVPETIRGCPVVGIDQLINVNMKTLSLPNTVREVGRSAFQNNLSLEKITMPQSLKTVGQSAFYNCKSLKEIDFSYVENVGINCFSECVALEKVTLSNNLKEISGGMFYKTGIKSLSIPRSVEKICSAAFHSSAIETVIIPGTVKVIEGNAFYQCNNLKMVIICYGTEKLFESYNSHGTFYGCDNLEEIYIPDTVIDIHTKVVLDADNAIVYCGENSYAADFCKEQKISYLIDNSVNSKINVLYQGKRVSFHNYNQNPEIIDGRTMVPLRSIFEAIGAEVEWNNDTQTVNALKGGTKIILQIGSTKMYVNGVEKTLDVPAKLVNGRTMVPVRAVSEAFGCNVEWDNNTRTVLISE